MTSNNPDPRTSYEQLLEELGEACDTGDFELAQALHKQWPSNPPPAAKRAEDLTDTLVITAQTGLQRASRAGDFNQVQSIIQQWRHNTSMPDPEECSLRGALADAAQHGYSRIVSYLLGQGAEVTPFVASTATATEIKPNAGSIAVFQGFLDHGWDINSKSHGGTPIIWYVPFPTTPLPPTFEPNQPRTAW